MRRLFLSLVLLITLPTVTEAIKYRETFEKEFLTKPWAGEQVEESVCVGCHTSEVMKTAYQKIPEEWKKSWHYENKVSCHNCHGGDPNDPDLSMSHQQRGFLGTPKYTAVPEFCGKCHIGILQHYLESDHGKALKSSGTGPNCVTCHGSHNIQKASIEIINEQLCSRCHSFERAKIMRQALFHTENKIRGIDKDLRVLKGEGIFVGAEEKTLFSTQAEVRTLFHTEAVSLIKDRTEEFIGRLSLLERKIQDTFKELHFRRNFSAFLMLVFIGMGIVVALISKTPKE